MTARDIPIRFAALSEGSARSDPKLELRRLRIELTRAEPDHRVGIYLRLAEVQEQELDELEQDSRNVEAQIRLGVASA